MCVYYYFRFTSEAHSWPGELLSRKAVDNNCSFKVFINRSVCWGRPCKFMYKVCRCVNRMGHMSSTGLGEAHLWHLTFLIVAQLFCSLENLMNRIKEIVFFTTTCLRESHRALLLYQGPGRTRKYGSLSARQSARRLNWRLKLIWPKMLYVYSSLHVVNNYTLLSIIYY